MASSKRATIMFAIAIFVAACTTAPQQESTGQYVDDAVITSRIKAALLAEPTLRSAEIGVETFKSVVQLSGFVSSRDNMLKAATIAGDTKGVTGVKSDMRLKP
jgi:osmotically-inducible protein OsmY